MHRLGIIHDDVLMKMFRYSLEGKAHEWCRSLPAASVASLRDFHVAFNSYCKQKYYVDFLYEECCVEFDLLYTKSANYTNQNACKKEIVVEDNILHNSQRGLNGLYNDVLSQETGIGADQVVSELFYPSGNPIRRQLNQPATIFSFAEQ
jgi:hypothetical protein